jgi:hypothetical protein
MEGSTTNCDWYNSHFGFSINQTDKVDFYDAWKEKDLELRIEHCDA